MSSIKGINIILDENDPMSPVLVEIENDDGKSICIGQRINRPDGLVALRITAQDIAKVLHSHHEECRALRDSGQRVRAVKLWRDATGDSLVDAVDAVRAL